MEQFLETKKRFEEALSGYSFPMPYAVWVGVPEKLKAAALYVQFYDQMTLAWYKAKADWVPDTDGISTLMQYILKNVPEIVNSGGKKYTEKYMYRIAYNCMGCLRRVDKNKTSYESCIQYVETGTDDEPIDLFAKIPVEDGMAEHFTNSAIWMIISQLTEPQRDAVDRLINIGQVSKPMLRKYPNIMEELREMFKEFNPYIREGSHKPMKFADVYDNPCISSAVVSMRDGVRAVYFGERRISRTGSVDVVFYGPNHDYIVPIEFANGLVVEDVEYISD